MPRLRAETSVAIPAPLPTDTNRASPLWWLRYVPLVILVLLVLDGLYVVGTVAIVPVLASFALAYVLNPLVEGIQRHRVSRPLAALLALLLVATAFSLFLLFVIPDLWDQSIKASERLLRNFSPENARQRTAELQQFSPFLYRMFGARLRQFLSSPQELLSWLSTASAGSLTNALSTAAASADLLLVPFFVYYILVDFPDWRGSTEDLIPPRFRAPFARLFDEIGRILQSYVLGQLLIAMIMGCLYAVGFAILKVPAWPGIAALSGFLNVIPYVGTALGIVLACGFTFSRTPELWRLGGVLAVFTIVQCIEGYYLTPRILGGRLSLHPMAVFLGLLIGGKLFGLLGILLAVPSIAIASVLLKLARELYRNSHFYHQGVVSYEQSQSTLPEEKLAMAAETVLSEQVDKQEGDELLAPTQSEDDPVARR